MRAYWGGYRAALLLLWGLGGCQELWSSTLHTNPANCVLFPSRCAADEVCNMDSEACEPALRLDAVLPVRGPSSGGISLTLEGQGFLPGTRVMLGPTGALEEPITLTSDSQLEATLPAAPGRCGPVSILLSRPGGIAVRRDGLFSYFLQDVKFTTGAAVGSSNSSSTVFLLAQDINHDGIVDVVSTAFNHGGVDVQLGSSTGSYQTLPRILTGSGPYYLSSADVNGDGNLDIAVANVYGNSVSLLLGSGDGQFLMPNNLSNTGAFSTHFIEVDGDGLLDLAVLTNTQKLRLWKGDGQGGFQFLSEAAINAGAGLSTAADVDGDGRIDLVVTGASGASLVVHRNLGNGTFQQVSANPLGSPAPSCAVADVNHDGFPDLIAAEYSAGQTSVMLGHGDGSFDAKVSYPTLAGSRIVTTGDWNCDGDLDLAVSHIGTPQVTLLTGHGDGTFEVVAQSAVSTGSSSLAIAAADVDADGHPDLLFGVEGTVPSVQVGRNVSR